MNNALSTDFAALTLYKVSTSVQKVFPNYPISSAFLKHLQSSLPNRDQEEKKKKKSLKLETPLLSHAILSTYFKFCLRKENKIVVFKVIFLSLASIIYLALSISYLFSTYNTY